MSLLQNISDSSVNERSKSFRKGKQIILKTAQGPKEAEKPRSTSNQRQTVAGAAKKQTSRPEKGLKNNVAESQPQIKTTGNKHDNRIVSGTKSGRKASQVLPDIPKNSKTNLLMLKDSSQNLLVNNQKVESNASSFVHNFRYEHY